MNTRNTRDEYFETSYYVNIVRNVYTQLYRAVVEVVANNPKSKAFRGRPRVELFSEILLRRSSTSRRIAGTRVSTSGTDTSGQEENDIDIVDNNDDNEEDDDEIRGAPAIAIRNLPLPKRVKTYIAKALRPNIHIGVYYYSKVYNECGPLSLLNILVE